MSQHEHPEHCRAMRDEILRLARELPKDTQLADHETFAEQKSETFDEVKADRRRWRHEYRIEKQKNTLLLSDRKQMRSAIGEFLIDWDREHFTDEVGPDLFDAVEELRRLIG